MRAGASSDAPALLSPRNGNLLKSPPGQSLPCARGGAERKRGGGVVTFRNVTIPQSALRAASSLCTREPSILCACGAINGKLMESFSTIGAIITSASAKESSTIGTSIEKNLDRKTSCQHDHTKDRQHSDLCTLANKAKSCTDSSQAPNNDSYFCRIHLFHICHLNSRFSALTS